MPKYKEAQGYFTHALRLSFIALEIRLLSSIRYLRFTKKWGRKVRHVDWSYELRSADLIDSYFLFSYYDEDDWPNFVHLNFLHTPEFLKAFKSWIATFRAFEDGVYKTEIVPVYEKDPELGESQILDHPKFLEVVAHSKEFLPLMEQELRTRLYRDLHPIQLFGRYWHDINTIDYQWLEEECQRQLALKKDV